ncbi:hypothetical protein HDV00_006931 [Rhizophlyctis rosea]|nr:hypothetical protein HDV00_006931 [Rhizophlyctis rosea]
MASACSPSSGTTSSPHNRRLSAFSSARASTVVVTSADAGTKLHKFVKKAFPTICTSRSQVHTAFKESKVLHNDELGREAAFVVEGDKVSLLRTVTESERDRDFVKIDVKYEDDYLAIVLKPAGLALKDHDTKTLELALPYNLSQSSQPDALDKPYPVNELNRAMSGLVVVAKTAAMKTSLKQMFNDHSMEIRHHLICHGNLKITSGKEVGEEFVIDEAIDGVAAETSCRILAVTRTRNSPSGFVSTAECCVLKGNSKHQIRIHFLKKGNPVIGNSKYTELHRSAKANGIYMTLTSIRFAHPITGMELTFSLPEPAKFEAFRVKDQRAWDQKREEEQAALSHAQSLGQLPNGETPAEGDDLLQKPLAYLTGRKEFYGLSFHVTPAVMVPRSATETLVNVAVQHLRQAGSSQPSILDLGTGSGCLLISALKALPSAIGVGLDASLSALQIAEENARSLEIFDRTKFVVGEFANVADALRSLHEAPDGFRPKYPFDVILCNPPYLTRKRTKLYEAQALAGEPEEALFAGETGFEAYHAIETGLREAIASGVGAGSGEEGTPTVGEGTLLVLEVPPGMALEVRKIFERRKRRRKSDGGSGNESTGEISGPESSQGAWQFVELLKDDKEMDRCMVFRRISHYDPKSL